MFDAIALCLHSSTALCLHECPNCILLNCSMMFNDVPLLYWPTVFDLIHSISSSGHFLCSWIMIFQQLCNLHFHLFLPRLIHQIHIALFRHTKRILMFSSDYLRRLAHVRTYVRTRCVLKLNLSPMCRKYWEHKYCSITVSMCVCFYPRSG